MNENKSVMVGQGQFPCSFNEEQIELIKKTVAKNTTNDELALFLYTCKRTGLDPLIKQIYAIKRGGASNQMSIQTGIDGYRLIAERSGKYAPSREPFFKEEGGKLVSATAYVNKLVGDKWWEVAATAYFTEYNNPTNHIWQKMPHAMLAKCAEALCLRKCFPAEMAGVYTHEEMIQAEVVEEPAKEKPAQPELRRPERQSEKEPSAEELRALAEQKAKDYHKDEVPANRAETQPAGNQPHSDYLKSSSGMISSSKEANKWG